MGPTDHADVIAARDDVVVRVLAGAEGVDDALALLDEAEALAAAPLVDEAERARLERLALRCEERASHWHSVLARRGDQTVGYAGVLLPTARGGVATGDLAVARDRPPAGPVLSALLAGLEGLARRHGAAGLVVWIRRATAPDVACAAGEGFGIERRLGVLGRRLEGVEPVGPPAGIEVRAYRPDIDDDAVVGVLASAYAGTPDGGWTLERFRERRAYDWFRAEDLLVADAGDGDLRGLHWLKRRGSGVGEVYNLAIAPDAQGGGLGAVLLTAGLAHLAAEGLGECLLWVDLANEQAVRLYAAHGFQTRWEDVALGRTLRGTPRG
ncbi:MAG: GNAT family N-acetyltransferase [Actinobacteria bacterium]|nr:GNAT family N-acetyltransferase [Actinomycetota bacterium]